jgi:apolipoprotein N-acyltransferase
LKKNLEPFIRHSRYLAAIGTGLLLALAFPKFSFAGFAWIVPALMLAAAHGKSGGERFRLGYISGLAFWLATLYWLLLIPVTGFPILGWLALSAFVALFSGLWVWLISHPSSGMNGFMDKWIDEKPQQSINPSIHQSVLLAPGDSWTGRTLWALGGAAAWVALEMLRARIFGGFPWNLLGVSQYQLIPLIQIAAFAGVYGVSFLVVWFSLALYSAALMIFRHPARRHVWQAEIVLPLLVIVGCYVGGYFSLNRSVAAEQFLRVTAIQPSVPQTLIWSSGDDAKRFQELLELSQRALTNRTDLLLWPESAVPSIDEPTYQAINQFAQSNHVWIILNDDDVELHPTTTNFFNSAFLVGPDGQRWQVYHKRDLVIFGEYVPLANWLPFLKWFTPITGGWTSGDKPATFELERRTPFRRANDSDAQPAETLLGAPVKTSPLICFEDTFPGTTREAAQDDVDFLVNLTNDGWFGDSAEQWQHMAGAVFRAVENGLPLLRCANNGMTCLIDGHGRMIKIFRDAHGSEYGPGALTVEIPLLQSGEKSAPTFYNRHGDWFGWGCVGISIWMLGAKFLQRKKNLNKTAAATPLS